MPRDAQSAGDVMEPALCSSTLSTTCSQVWVPRTARGGWHPPNAMACSVPGISIGHKLSLTLSACTTRSHHWAWRPHAACRRFPSLTHTCGISVIPVASGMLAEHVHVCAPRSGCEHEEARWTRSIMTAFEINDLFHILQAPNRSTRCPGTHLNGLQDRISLKQFSKGEFKHMGHT